jgi:3-methyladenine DNA glycosylase/8-oxoguanine DNA glycosylase
MEKMDNQAIHDVLIEYKYLGEWTIAMILIFTYFRTDILPITDFGIRKGLCKLYQQEKISDVFIDKLRERLGNYATLFSFCLWRINQNV